VVCVATAPTATDVTTAVAAGVTTIIHRRQATAERLADPIAAAAAGGADLPADLLRGLLDHTRDLHHTVLRPAGLTPTGCTPRQVQVLHLIATGHTTAQIATLLHQSERTVKSDLAAYASRYELRNRAHAVAHAIRAGII
jgi:DNA-binding NarL/FixJ family response regulator